MGELVIIAPESEPGGGGVADYTLRLVEQLPNREQISILIPPLDLKALPASGNLLVQYSAYGFDRLGYPADLIRTLINWKHKTGARLVVMFHEIWTFWPITNKNYFVQIFHRRALKKLMQCVDQAFTSTADQLKHLRSLNPTARIDLLPVGSNIRKMGIATGPRQPGTAVLFGLHLSRISTLQRMQGTLGRLASSGRITKLITVGAGSGSESNRELKLLDSLGFGQGFEQRGQQAEATVSQLLSAVSFGLFGQSELSYTKSGTFMAYAAHELNIISESAGRSKGEPSCWLVAPDELVGGISQPELRIRAERLRDWQEQTASWEMIAAKVANAFHLQSAGRSTVKSAGS